MGAVAQRFFESYVVDTKFDLDTVIDGTVHHFPSLLDVIVKNTRIFGGEWIFDANAEADDGKVELVPVIGRRDFLGKLLGTMRHVPVGMDDLEKLGIEHAPAIAGTHLELTVRAEGGVIPAAQVDGEEIPAGDRYVIDVAARALRLIVPHEHIDSLGAEHSGAVPVTNE
jgi:diacylglycerol kinase family enzyme